MDFSYETPPYQSMQMKFNLSVAKSGEMDYTVGVLESEEKKMKTHDFYYDLPEDKLEQVAVEEGFLEFFKNIYCVCEKDSFIPGEI